MNLSNAARNRALNNGDSAGVLEHHRDGSVVGAMRLTEEMLLKDLELLSHGGAEAISLFMEMAARMRLAADDALNDWVTLALPALPERERAEVVVMLMMSQVVKRRLH